MVTLSRRFTGAFLLIVALPALGVAIALSRVYLSALYETVALQSDATAEQVARNIEAEVGGAAVLASALSHDLELRRLAAAFAHAAGRGEQYVAGRRLDDKLVSFFTFSNRIGAVSLHLRGGAVYTYSNYPNLRALARVERAVWAPAAADPGKVHLLDTLEGIGDPGETHLLSIAVCPGPEEDSEIEAILVVIRVPYFDGLTAGPGGEAGPDVLMLGRSGRPILSSLPDPAVAGALAGALRQAAAGAPGDGALPGVRALAAGKRAYVATVRRMASSGWTVAILSDKAALAARATRHQWYLYPAIGLLVLLFAAYAELFFARVAAPVRAIVGHMARVGRGDRAVRAAPQKIAELAELSEGFNRMVEEAARLDAERARVEREKRGAELDALRYQINPHFVANTLSQIRLMAQAARADAIAGVTRDLMRVLADSYAAAEPVVELGRELETVAAYVSIMKVRLGELFTLETEVAPGAERALLLRMILQPVVENAILHGFSARGAPRTTRGTLRVRARLERRELPPPPPPAGARVRAGEVLVVEVEDDGAGMPPERAAEVLEAPAQRGGLSRIGIANVQQRIRLEFGAAYGLELATEPGRFTLVRYVLPSLERAPEEAAVA